MRADHRLLAAIVVSLALVGVAGASGCAEGPPVAAPVAAPQASTSLAPLQSDAGPEATHQDAPRLDGGPYSKPILPLCGCALCGPVVSEDACTQDSDCAPATPCHAEACVAKAKAKPPTPQTSCTMILRCNSVDANTCGCLEGRCALYPRKK